MKLTLPLIIFLLCGIAFSAFGKESDCHIGNRLIGYENGEDLAIWNALVSKAKGEQLSPLAIPHPLRPIPIALLNPNNQNYYRNSRSTEYLQEDAALSAMSLIAKAKEQGLQLFVHSAYRSWLTQCGVFKLKVANEMKTFKTDLEMAIQSVNTRSALPGESEHQLATAIDFVTDIPGVGYRLEFEFYRTSTYQWLQENAGEYRFVMSFPQRDDLNMKKPHPKTQIIFEPWHWRYVGVYHARIYKNCQEKMTMQEFLRALSKDSNFRCE